MNAFCYAIRRHASGKPDYAQVRAVAAHVTAAPASAAS